MTGVPTLSDVSIALARYRLTGLDERQLQDGIEAVLGREELPYEREARLSARDRVDFLVGHVAVEVKIRGAQPDVLRQLQRYADHPNVTSLLLVTTVPRHQTNFPATLHGLPARCLVVRGRLA